MLLESFLLVVVFGVACLYFAGLVKTKYLFFLLAGILLLIAGIGAFSGIEFATGEATTYVGGTIANATGMTTEILRTTVKNLPTDAIGLTLIGISLYLILVTPFIDREGEGEYGD